MLITCLFLRWTVVLSCSQKSKRIPKTVRDYTLLSILSSGVWKLKSIINASDEQTTMVNTPANQAFCERQLTKRGTIDCGKRVAVCFVSSACFYHLLEQNSWFLNSLETAGNFYYISKLLIIQGSSSSMHQATQWVLNECTQWMLHEITTVSNRSLLNPHFTH